MPLLAAPLAPLDAAIVTIVGLMLQANLWSAMQGVAWRRKEDRRSGGERLEKGPRPVHYQLGLGAPSNQRAPGASGLFR